MKHFVQGRLLQALSILFGATPFAFGLIRAVRTGYDLRYIWVACAALFGAVIVTTVVKADGSTRRGMVALTRGAFFVAALCAVGTAWLLGTAIGPGSMLVGFAFGFCCAVSCLLHTLARSHVLERPSE